MRTRKLLDELEERVARQDEAIRTMASWLAQAQTGFGEQDVRGIFRILDGEPAKPPPPAPAQRRPQ